MRLFMFTGKITTDMFVNNKLTSRIVGPQWNITGLPMLTIQLTMLYFDWPVSGCRDLETPADTWVQRRGNTLGVKCNSSIDTWYLTCTDSRWVGRVGNCSLGKGQWTGAVCERWHGFHVRQRPAFSSLLKGPWRTCTCMATLLLSWTLIGSVLFQASTF